MDYLSSKDVGLDVETTSFLDVGTGNGSLLFLLRGGGHGSEDEGANDEDDEDNDDGNERGREERRSRGGFRGSMVGVDYSAASVRLARRVAGERGMGPGGEKGEVRFEEWDVMREEPGTWMPMDGMTGGFDVVLDKGTFDAISLCEERDERGRRICEGYRDRVQGLVRRGGLLLVTSCNWTEAELRSWFEGDGEGKGELVCWGRVRYPSFTFGGRTGQAISSVCFKRKS